jgi:hypothetical protein
MCNFNGWQFGIASLYLSQKMPRYVTFRWLCRLLLSGKSDVQT